MILHQEAPLEAAGPIRVGPDGRSFVDAQGAPFFWLGDTAWPLFAQYEREQAERSPGPSLPERLWKATKI